MHPYEVETYVREQQHVIQLAFDRRRLITEIRRPFPAWRGRVLWRLGSMLIGCGRRLRRASGVCGTAAGHRGRVDLALR